MIKLHGISLSNYYNKVKLVLLEKGVPFSQVVQRIGSTDDAVLAASPLGKIPFVTLEDGRTLCESQVIVDYLEAAYPQPSLLPADPLAAAKVRELIVFMELHLELVGRELYDEAFFGAKVTDECKAAVRTRLLRNIPAFRRLARFAPYVAGSEFTLADAAAYAALPALAQACKAVLGEDLLAGAGIDLKSYLNQLSERPSVRRINADRRRDLVAIAAGASAVSVGHALQQKP